MLKFVTFAAVVGFGATSLIAQVSPIESSRSVTSSVPAANADPNKLICEKVEQIGTRLGARRICMTATQWAEQRREHREDIERAQRNTAIGSSN